MVSEDRDSSPWHCIFFGMTNSCTICLKVCGDSQRKTSNDKNTFMLLF